MRILVVGAGATGGYFGGRLGEAGRDVTFLVRPRRAEQLTAEGLRIVSPHGNVTLAPRLVVAGGIDNTFDAVLLTVKAYSLDAALDDIAPAVGPDTMILPVLNGMKHVDAITARFRTDALVGCVCKVATLLDEQGRIVQLAPLQELAYGEMTGARSARIEVLDRVMQSAGFDARLSSAIACEMWEKWVLLAALGGITCLMRGTVGEIAAAPGGTEVALRLLDEIVAIVRAVGEAPSERFLAEARNLLTRRGSAQTSSMYRDLQRGRTVEVEQIIGDLIARGRQAGIAAPLLDAVLVQLSIYQSQLAAV